MVAEIQLLSYLYHEEVTPVDFTPSDKYSTDDQIALIAFLLNLEEYYNLYQTLSVQEVAARIDSDIGSIKSEMSSLAFTLQDGFIPTLNKVMDKFNIRLDWFGSDFGSNLVDYDLFNASITGALNQLRDDIKSKCLYVQTFALGDILNIAPNFTRAVKRISDAVVNNISLAREKGTREIYKFVYGSDMLYKWVCVKDARTCSVCKAKAREEPKRIDEWDYDHPHGRCGLKPVSETYSDEYKFYLENYAYNI